MRYENTASDTLTSDRIYQYLAFPLDILTLTYHAAADSDMHNPLAGRYSTIRVVSIRCKWLCQATILPYMILHRYCAGIATLLHSLEQYASLVISQCDLLPHQRGTYPSISHAKAHSPMTTD